MGIDWILIEAAAVTLATPLLILLALPLLADTAAFLRAATRPRLRSLELHGKAGAGVQRLLFLVPAHNEEALLARCLRSLAGMRLGRASWSVVVAADSCDDATAAIARRAGANLIEHSAGKPLGKTRLIEWVLPQLCLENYAAIVIVDADTMVDPGFAEAVAEQAGLRDICAQARLGVLDPNRSWLSLLGDLLARVRFDGQLLLKQRAGLNAPLLGNGMCVGTEVLRRWGWRCETIKEDLELYARLTAVGVSIQYLPQARVFAEEPAALSDARIQRTRWQSGRMAVLRRHLLPALRAPGGFVQRLDTIGEMLALGPVVHASSAVVLGSVLLSFGGIARMAGFAAIATLVPTIGWTLQALCRHRDRSQVVAALTRLPIYAAWRLLLAVSVALRPSQNRWQRSTRPSASE